MPVFLIAMQLLMPDLDVPHTYTTVCIDDGNVCMFVMFVSLVVFNIINITSGPKLELQLTLY